MLSASDSAASVSQVPPTIHPRQTLGFPRALQLWHLTSLDAPTVASVWTWFVARTVHAPILPAELAAMFVAVWMIYATDRLLDASHSQSSSASHTHLQPRHLFHLHHRRGLLAWLVFALAPLGLLLTRFPRSELQLDLALLAALAAWFLLIHRIAPRFRLPKELALSVFFPAAVFLPAFFHSPHLRAQLMLPAILFGSLCAINALFIHRWEALSISPQIAIKQEDALTHWLLLHLRPLTSLFCIGTAAAVLLLRGPAYIVALDQMPHRYRVVILNAVKDPCIWPNIATLYIITQSAIASGLSAAGLLVLDRAHLRFKPTDLRALADLVLLSPLLLTPWLR